MSIWPDEIMTPLHVHGVRSPAEYRQKQRMYIASARMQAPGLRWRDPWLSLEHPDVLIAAGKWLVWCECGNYPSVHPEWRLACCFECGAIYEDLVVPPEAIEIARVLSRRPKIQNRAWLAPQTLDDVRAENVEHGIEG